MPFSPSTPGSVDPAEPPGDSRRLRHDEEPRSHLTLAHVLALALLLAFVGWMTPHPVGAGAALAIAAGCAAIVVGMSATPRVARKLIAAFKAMN